MTIRDIVNILDAEIVLEGDDLDAEVLTACGSDMMSDVLAYVKEQSVLLTGLNNGQVVRTAEMMDMVCIVFVRGKIPNPEIAQLARPLGITVLTTKHSLFTSCGKLFEKGLRGRSLEDHGK